MGLVYLLAGGTVGVGWVVVLSVLIGLFVWSFSDWVTTSQHLSEPIGASRPMSPGQGGGVRPDPPPRSGVPLPPDRVVQSELSPDRPPPPPGARTDHAAPTLTPAPRPERIKTVGDGLADLSDIELRSPRRELQCGHCGLFEVAEQRSGGSAALVCSTCGSHTELGDPSQLYPIRVRMNHRRGTGAAAGTAGQRN